jgi:hypothetical protein
VLALSNSPASSVASFSAALNSTLACTGSVYNVYACWNTVNGGTNATLWTNSAYVGSWTNLTSTNLTFTATNLAPSKLYYFTFRATNAVDTLWATNVQSFTTLTPPVPGVDNTAGATNLSPGIAQLRGTLTNGPADVRLYWGTTDGGTNKGNWANTNLLASTGSGAFSSNASNLLYGLAYHYRGYASNQYGTAWAPATTNFTTLRPASSLANSAATGITTNAAALNATLGCTGAVYNVVAFWNTIDGGTNAALWANSAYVGSRTNVVSSSLSVSATGLAPNTPYFFTFRATNSLDTLWATNVQSFTTLAPLGPVVDNDGGAMNLSPGLAQLRGTLGNGPADVRLYWGTTDGGTNKGNWANTNLLAGAASGAFSATVSNLLYGLTYYYRGYASNQWGAAWATATTNFTTLRPVSTLANSAATGLATTGAVLNATLASAGALYDVVAYWNTVNGGADPAQWANSAYIGKWTDVVSTNLSVTATGLAPNTPYFFTFLATNALDTLWATNVQSFTTLAPLPPPLVISGMTVAGDGTGSIAGTGATGQTFVLMQSPDLAAPSSLWTPVLTNSEGIGAFNFSIPVGLEPSVYFRVFAY